MYLRVDILHKENFMEIKSRETFFFFFSTKTNLKNEVAVSTTKYQKSAFFSLQYIYNDLSKSTEILSVCSFCFYRLVCDSKIHLQSTAFIYRKYVVFEASICHPEIILWPRTLLRYILVKGNNVDVSHTISPLSSIPDIGPNSFKDKRSV